MTRLGVLPILAAFLAFPFQCHAFDGNDLVLHVFTDSAQYDAGDSVEISVEKCNPTDQAITVSHSSGVHFDLEIWSSSDEVVAQYSYGGGGTMFDITWLPGDCTIATFNWPQCSGFFDAFGGSGVFAGEGKYRAVYYWYPNPSVDSVTQSPEFQIGGVPIPIDRPTSVVFLALLISGLGFWVITKRNSPS